MMHVRVFSNIYDTDLKIVNMFMCEYQDVINDPISDESFKLLIPNGTSYFPKVGDIIFIKRYEFFGIITEVINRYEIQIKHIIEIFNHNDIKHPNITSFFNTYFNFFKANDDYRLNLPNISLFIDTNLKISQNKNKNSTSDTINYKQLFIDSCLLNKASFYTSFFESNSDALISLNVGVENEKDLNINDTSFFANIPKLPKKNAETTALNIIVEVTNETTQTVTTYNQIWYLRTDNTVTNNINDVNRLFEIRYDTIKLNMNDTDYSTFSYQQTAEENMLDSSSTNVVLEIFNSGNILNFKELKLFQIYNIYVKFNSYANGELLVRKETFKALLTGVKFMKNTTELRFGLGRNDLVFQLNQIKKK